MTDKKDTALTENAAPLGTDLLRIVDDPTGTPLSQKMLMYRVSEVMERNYKITPTVTSSNLTVALKDRSGNNASATNTILFKIGDNWRAVTAALSITMNAATNWMNAGSAELATQSIDYFVYIGYNATDGITLGVSRIPWAKQYGDFSTTSTSEKYARISTITNAVSSDVYTVIGRFSATLSAGAGYTWTVPSFNATNLIQFPIYETQHLTYAPQWAGGTPAVGNGTLVGKYMIKDRQMWYHFLLIAGTTTTFGAGTLTWSFPFTVLTYVTGSYYTVAFVFDNSASTLYAGIQLIGSGAASANIRTHGTAGAVTSAVPVTLATSDQIGANGWVPLA